MPGCAKVVLNGRVLLCEIRAVRRKIKENIGRKALAVSVYGAAKGVFPNTIKKTSNNRFIDSMYGKGYEEEYEKKSQYGFFEKEIIFCIL